MKSRDRKIKLVRFLEALTGLSLLILTGLACLQVVLRYGFGASLFWVEEVSVMLMIWMAWLGASLLWLTQSHLSVTFLTRSKSSRTQKFIAQVTDLLVVAGALGLGYASLETLKAFHGMSLGALDIDASIKYLPISAGALCLAASALVNFRSAGSEVNKDSDGR